MTIRSMNRLNAKSVAALGDGFHSDGGNLYLMVRDEGRKRSWVLRIVRAGKVTSMGLGAASAVSLKQAREKRDELMQLVERGINPLAERRRTEQERANRKTFGEVAQMVIARKIGGWKGGPGGSSAWGWSHTVAVTAKPIAALAVDEIEVDHVKRCVSPMWDAGHHASARGALARIATVIDFAIAHGWRKSGNPASRGVFKHIEPDRPRGAKAHFPALDWRDAPAALAELRQSDAMAALVLEFVILTGARLSEAARRDGARSTSTRRCGPFPPSG